jgi:hypothetical protein
MRNGPQPQDFLRPAFILNGGKGARRFCTRPWEGDCGQAYSPNSDFAQRGCCVAEGRKDAFADKLCNAEAFLRNLLRHQVRWGVTRRLDGIEGGMAGMIELPEIEPLWRGDRAMRPRISVLGSAASLRKRHSSLPKDTRVPRSPLQRWSRALGYHGDISNHYCFRRSPCGRISPSGYTENPASCGLAAYSQLLW